MADTSEIPSNLVGAPAPDEARISAPLKGAGVKESIFLPAWTPFREVISAPASDEQIERVRQARSLSREAALEACKLRSFKNSRYVVHRSDAHDEYILLLIARHDKMPPGPERYQDFMRVRDELIGPDHDALELYPRRSRELDLENVYHVWVSASPDRQFALGYNAPIAS